MLVRELMNRNIVTIAPEESVALAARLLARHNVGALPVCSQDNRLRGILTDRDIVLRCVAVGADPARIPVDEVMTHSVLTAAPDDDTDALSRSMAMRQIRRLPVLDGGRLVGMISLADLARTSLCQVEASRALAEISANIRRK